MSGRIRPSALDTTGLTMPGPHLHPPGTTPSTLTMHFKAFAFLTATAVMAATNEPCIGSGGRAGKPSHLVHSLQATHSLTLLPRRLPHNLGLHLRRGHHHHRRLPRRRRRHQVLHQAHLQQRRLGQLPLAVRLRRHLCLEPVPRPRPNEVLLLDRDRIRRVRGAQGPRRGRVPAGVGGRGEEGGGCVPRESERDFLYEGLRVPGDQ